MFIKHQQLLIIIITLFGFLPTLSAQPSYAGRTELGVHYGAFYFEGDENLDDGKILGVRLGHYFSEQFMLEVSVFKGESEIERSTREADLLIPMAEALFHFGDGRFRPFLAIGGGLLDVDRDGGPSDSDFIIPVGGGVKWLLTRSIVARVDARYVSDFFSRRGTHDALLTGGLAWLFGARQEKPEPVKPEPEPEPEPEPVPIQDNDQDGVPDSDDLCPQTPPNAPVDENGCRLDSDADGVFDYLDKCPGTPAGVQVGTDGCKPPQKVKIDLDIKFDSGKAVIKPEFEDQVKKVIDFMTTYPSTNAEIEGHTDNVGSVKFNKGLSQRRADSVRTYIIRKGGIDAARVKAVGYGPDKPIADNKTKAGRAKNRRVVATLTAVQ